MLNRENLNVRGCVTAAKRRRRDDATRPAHSMRLKPDDRAASFTTRASALDASRFGLFDCPDSRRVDSQSASRRAPLRHRGGSPTRHSLRPTMIGRFLELDIAGHEGCNTGPRQSTEIATGATAIAM